MFNHANRKQTLLKADGETADGTPFRLTMAPTGFEIFISNEQRLENAVMLKARGGEVCFSRIKKMPVIMGFHWVLPITEQSLADLTSIVGAYIPYHETNH